MTITPITHLAYPYSLYLATFQIGSHFISVTGRTHAEAIANAIKEMTTV